MTTIKLKTCTECEADKPLNQFNKNKRARGGHRNQCKDCQGKYRTKHYQSHREKELKQAKVWRRNNPEKVEGYYRNNKETGESLLKRAKHRAKQGVVPFEIKLEHIPIPEVCPALGIPIVIHSPMKNGRCGPEPDSPSIDRIIPSLGYVPGNVKVISVRANKIKSDATIDELEKIVAYVHKELNQ